MKFKWNVYLIYFEDEIIDEVLALSKQDALYRYGGIKVNSKFKAVKK